MFYDSQDTVPGDLMWQHGSKSSSWERGTSAAVYRAGQWYKVHFSTITASVKTMWLLTRRGIIREQGVTECLTQPLLILAFVCLLFLLSSPACDHHHSLLLPLGITVPAYLPVSKPLQVHAKHWMIKGTSPSNVTESHSQWTNYVYVEQKEQKAVKTSSRGWPLKGSLCVRLREMISDDELHFLQDQ